MLAGVMQMVVENPLSLPGGNIRRSKEFLLTKHLTVYFIVKTNGIFRAGSDSNVIFN
jgi:hypothetical protein